MKFTKIISLCLCLLLCASCFLVACSGDKDEGDKDSESTADKDNHGDDGEKVTTGYDKESGQYVVELPEGLELNGKEFNMCIVSNEIDITYYSEEIVPDLYDTTDAQLNEAVKKRNDHIQEKYGVEIKADPVGDATEAMRLDVSGGTKEYDAALLFMPGAAKLAQDDYLYNLYDDIFKGIIHLDQPWWDKGAEEASSISNKLYFATGDITIMPKIVSIAITFNKKMMKNHFPDVNLYDMVKKKEWTFDKMVEMSKQVTMDSDGVTGMTIDDTWGLSSSHGDASMFYLASGNKYIAKDKDDLPILAFGTEASISVAQNILEQLQLGDEWNFNCQTADVGGKNIWVASLDVFGQNRSLFRTSAFSAIKKLRKYPDADEFGLVPIPLMTKDQDRYYTPCNSAYAYAVAIPTSLDENEAKFSAAVIELMAVGAKNLITPAYYTTTLKYRDLKDEESEDMLDNYIFNNIVYDIGIIYNFGGVSNILGKLMAATSIDIASTLESSKDLIQQDIDDCIEAFGA